MFAFGALIVVAPHLLGGIFAWGTLSLAVSSVVLAGVSAWAWRPPEGPTGEPLALLLGMFLAVTVLQALPLPLWIANAVAGDAVRHAAAVDALLGLPPSRALPFTLDPGRTHERILYAAAVWAAFCAAHLAAARQRSFVLGAVALSGVTIALSHLGHVLFEANEVYGLYRPAYTDARGPLMNPNNLAGMLALSTPVCLGLAAKFSRTRVYWVLAAVICGAMCVYANSRGGTAVLVGGVGLFGVCMAWNRRAEAKAARRKQPARPQTPMAVTLLLSSVVIGMSFALVKFAADQPLDTNYQNLSKLEMLEQEARYLVEDPQRMLLGIGRGALPDVLSAPRFGTRRVLYAENFALQYAIELGVPLALLFIGAMCLRVVRAFVASTSPRQLGGLCGCVALGVQNIGDFSLELSGIAVPAAACLGASLPPVQSTFKWLRAGRLTWASAAAGVAVLLVFGRSALVNDAPLQQFKLERLVQQKKSDEFWPLFDQASAAHPADPGFAYLGAGRKVFEGSKDAWKWVERAIDMAPHWGGPRVLAAHWLLSQRQQERALDQLAAGAERDPHLARRTLCEWLRRAPYAQIAFRVAPKTEPGRRIVLDRSAECLAAASKEAAKVDAALLRADPDLLSANVRSLRRRLAAGDRSGLAVDAQVVQRKYPREAAPYQVEAQSWLADGQPAEAVRALRLASVHVEDRRPVLTDLVIAYARAGDAEGMRSTVEQLRFMAGGEPRHLAHAMLQLARGEGWLGNNARSLKAARDAYELMPDPAAIALSAQAAEKLGQKAIALEEWERACREDKVYCRARDALRARESASLGRLPE